MRAAVAAAIVTLGAAACGGDDGSETPEPPTPPAIAFASDRDGDFDIYVMRPDGTGVRNLTRNASSDTSEAADDAPVWSPDGRFIAFTSTRDHRGRSIDETEVYVMRADGRNERRLTANRAPDLSPHWTRDGELVYTSCDRDQEAGEGAPPPECVVVVMKPDGEDRRVVLDGLGLTLDAQLSPDGEHLAATRIRRDGPRLVLIDVNDGDTRVLARVGRLAAEPRWSADGKQLVFLSDRDRNGPCLFYECFGFATEVYSLELDGGSPRRLTRSRANEQGPSWTPDGAKLVFARIADEDDGHDLYVANADGSCERRLTRTQTWEVSASWYGSTGAPLEC